MSITQEIYEHLARHPEQEVEVHAIGAEHGNGTGMTIVREEDTEAMSLPVGTILMRTHDKSQTWAIEPDGRVTHTDSI
jgi:hypothetical protein